MQQKREGGGGEKSSVMSLNFFLNYNVCGTKPTHCATNIVTNAVHYCTEQSIVHLHIPW